MYLTRYTTLLFAYTNKVHAITGLTSFIVQGYHDRQLVEVGAEGPLGKREMMEGSMPNILTYSILSGVDAGSV